MLPPSARRSLAWLFVPLLMLLAPRTSQAFCGFFAAQSDATLVSEASSLVIMRDGQRSVLTLQPYYRGPIEDFSMIIPVPSVLRRHQVKTLPHELLERVDTLAAPRLVEYWEQDPCAGPRESFTLAGSRSVLVGATGRFRRIAAEPKVRVEAKFSVGEYEILILGARDSLALEDWLRSHDYQLPEGASEALRPYVEAGMRFFVARVSARKVKFEGERALLSPLRFYYDSPDLSIPVRLGLLNAAGSQDVVVTVIARGGRYEAANRPNITIPTNLDLEPTALDHFDEFYAALIDHSFAAAPEAVITEYAWPVSSCDPCPSTDATLGLPELVSLGLDLMPISAEWVDQTPTKTPPADMWLEESLLQRGFEGLERREDWPNPSDFTVTRMRVRVAPEDAHHDDIVLRRAGPIEGGREYMEPSVQRQALDPYRSNNFQARYAVRHPWTGPIRCDAPVRGRWGGSPASRDTEGELVPSKAPAFVRTTRKLEDFLLQGALGAQDYDGRIEAETPDPVEPLTGFARCSVAGSSRGPDGELALLGLLGLCLGVIRLRRRSARPD